MEQRLPGAVRGLCKVASERSCGEEAEGDAQATHLPPPGKDDSVALASRNKRLFPTPETSQEPRRALFTRSGAHSRLEVLWKYGVDSVGPGWLRVCVSNKAAIPRGLLGGSRAEVTWRGAGRGGGLGCELIPLEPAELERTGARGWPVRSHRWGDRWGKCTLGSFSGHLPDL